MPIYLRNGVWQIDIVHNGKRIRRTAGTADKTEAQELHDKVKHELWHVEMLDNKPERIWDEACVRWLKEKAHKKSLKSDKIKIRLLTDFRGKLLNELSRDYIMNIIDSLECSHSTKNRYLSLIKAILKKCAGEWEWIDRAPTLTAYKEPKKRIRWITEPEAQRLIEALPGVIADIAHFSLMTGLRQSNVLKLEWSQVDLLRQVAWIYADQAKADRAIGVPLNLTALEILNKQKGRHHTYVFVRDKMDKMLKQRTPYNSINSITWKSALERAEITNFRWHDLRHTWASWLVQSGVPLMELKEMGGWESIEMVMRYAHLAPEHLHKNAVLVDRLNVTRDKVHVTNLSHEKNALVGMLGGL